MTLKACLTHQKPRLFQSFCLEGVSKWEAKYGKRKNKYLPEIFNSPLNSMKNNDCVVFVHLLRHDFIATRNNYYNLK